MNVPTPKTWDECAELIISRLKSCIQPDKVDDITMKTQKDGVFVDVSKLLPEAKFRIPVNLQDR